MSVTLIVSDRIAGQLQRLQWTKSDKTEDKLAKLIEAEYRRRLAHYSLTDCFSSGNRRVEVENPFLGPRVDGAQVLLKPLVGGRPMLKDSASAC